MNLNLLANSELLDNDRYILDHVFDGNIITNDNYQGLFVLDKFLKKIRKFRFKDKFLATHYYLSDDCTCFLAYNENGFLHYINLVDPSFEPITLRISDDVSLYSEYIWNENRFIIAARNGDFFCYDILNHNFYNLDRKLNNNQLMIFNKLNHYNSMGRLFYYDWKKNIFVYGIYDNGTCRIFWKNLIKEIEIEFMSPLIDVYRAECVDDLMFLINDESVVFFHLSQEIYRFDIKQNYRSFGARLYKH